MELYVLFGCDEWKSKESMGLIGVFDEVKIKEAIRKLIKHGDVDWEIDKTIDEVEANQLNKYIKYAYIEQFDLNDMQYV